MKLPRATKQLRKSLKTWGCWLYGSCSLIVWLTALSLGKKQQCWRPPAGHAKGAAGATRRLSSLKHMDLVQERRGREAEACYLFSICGCRKGAIAAPSVLFLHECGSLLGGVRTAGCNYTLQLQRKLLAVGSVQCLAADPLLLWIQWRWRE